MKELSEVKAKNRELADKNKQIEIEDPEYEEIEDDDEECNEPVEQRDARGKETGCLSRTIKQKAKNFLNQVDNSIYKTIS